MFIVFVFPKFPYLVEGFLYFLIAYSKSANFLPGTGSKGMENEIQVQKQYFKLVIVSKQVVCNDFWLFLRSLSCIGSSRRLVGRISAKLSKSEEISHLTLLVFGFPKFSTSDLTNNEF